MRAPDAASGCPKATIATVSAGTESFQSQMLLTDGTTVDIALLHRQSELALNSQPLCGERLVDVKELQEEKGGQTEYEGTESPLWCSHQCRQS